MYPDDLVVPRTMIKALVDRMGHLVGGPEEPVHLVPQDAAVVLHDGSPVRERPRWLGPNRLFAMSSEPVVGDVLAGSPTLVFLSAGALDHTGPGRQWVELTRGFATGGLRTLRVDLDGVGESEGRPDLPRNVPKLATAIDDVCDLCAALGDPEAGDIVFVGLSSGGYHAIEVALRLHPRAICVMNPGTTAPVAELDRRASPSTRDASPTGRGRRCCGGWPSSTTGWRASSTERCSRWRSGARRIAPSPEVGRRRIPFLLILTEEDSEQFEPSPYWWLVRRRLERKQGSSTPGSCPASTTPSTRSRARTTPIPSSSRGSPTATAGSHREPRRPRSDDVGEAALHLLEENRPDQEDDDGHGDARAGSARAVARRC